MIQREELIAILGEGNAGEEKPKYEENIFSHPEEEPQEAQRAQGFLCALCLLYWTSRTTNSNLNGPGEREVLWPG